MTVLKISCPRCGTETRLDVPAADRVPDWVCWCYVCGTYFSVPLSVIRSGE